MQRSEVIQKARKKYIGSGITNNITEALRMYLEKDATEEEQIPLFISAPVEYAIKRELKLVRPVCDECEGELFMQIEIVSLTSGEHFPTAWICKTCNKIEYSNKTPEQWLEILKNENRE